MIHECDRLLCPDIDESPGRLSCSTYAITMFHYQAMLTFSFTLMFSPCMSDQLRVMEIYFPGQSIPIMFLHFPRPRIPL